jgi:membrane protein implicated in regulation of membrane protease activity
MSLATGFQATDLFPFQGQGVVERTITPLDAGRVYFQATYWPARLYQPTSSDALQPGDPVEVLGRDGLTLLIKPLAQGRRTS